MDSLMKLICEVFKIKEIDENLNINNIDSWDSLTHMDLITSLEEKYNIVFTMDEIMEMRSVKKIKEIVKKKVG